MSPTAAEGDAAQRLLRGSTRRSQLASQGAVLSLKEGSDIDYERLMNSKEGLAKMLEFAQLEYSAENLLFYQQVQQYQKFGKELETLKPPERKPAPPAGRRPSLTMMAAGIGSALKPGAAPSVDPGYAVAEAPKRRNSLFGRDGAAAARSSEAGGGGRASARGEDPPKVLTAEEAAAVMRLETHLGELGRTIIDQFCCRDAETLVNLPNELLKLFAEPSASGSYRYEPHLFDKVARIMRVNEIP